VPGSYLALTHFTGDVRRDAAANIAAEFARLHITTPLIPRTHRQIAAFLDGYDLVPPGLVFPTQWDPQQLDAQNPGAQWMYAGVGYKTISSAAAR
jgi:hypothetical protein